MRYKVLFLVLFILFIPQLTHAKSPNVTIIYSSKSKEVPSEVYKLDALVSHFTENIEILRDSEVTIDSLDETSHLFYFGLNPSTIPLETRKQINQSSSVIYGIGFNVNQLDAFKNISTKKKQGVSKFHQERTNKSLTFELADTVLSVENRDHTVQASFIHQDVKTPIIVQSENYFYSGIYNLLNRSSLLVADSLFDFFSVEGKNEHLGYIRLEDINPSTDPSLLKEVGEYLLNRDIPLILAVITVYIDPESQQNVHYTDRPELLKVIKELEQRGASVISHGYTHQYRFSETGEGFEFWDVENDQPVLVAENETPPTLKFRESFSNEKDYQMYRKNILNDQVSYINSKLTNSIHELVTLGLHPIGFEAPHYTMSHSGYELTANQFSNIFGQIQWSQTDWEIMGSTPYISKPSLLHGMTLYPETIGYVRTDLPRPVDEMRRARDELMLVRESMIGGFYHPYIGMEHLADLIDMMESTPGFQWLNLRNQNEWVRTEDVSIQTSNGTISLQDNRSPVWSQLKLHMPNSFLEKSLWALAIITFTAVLMFLVYTLYLRTQRKKRLFKERG
ncbi:MULTISPECIES: DUF2334 domain-containing protein [unclassified Exiguobacterium]|uniref:DUF2334 domain-containing protein n=1 Tax=unclassified Exiguobacterium TaxID=2644629 RepID=UPI001BE711D3|nr:MULTISPECIES: DUF2334 domain-containing protein [unclassified Exiguobacterium]